MRDSRLRRDLAMLGADLLGDLGLHRLTRDQHTFEAVSWG